MIDKSQALETSNCVTLETCSKVERFFCLSVKPLDPEGQIGG
jgi:hypothetical protein